MPGELESPLVTRSHGLHLREVRKEAREASFIASTDAIDSYDEIVEQVWQLERFLSNPVILYAHQSRELPIGIATMCAMLDGKLQCTVRFVTEDKNPLAEQVWKMVRDGELRAVSVGFRPHSYRWEKQADREVLVLSDNELLEISVVPIPANPEALAKIRAKARAEASTNVAASAAQEKTMKTIEELTALVQQREAEVRTAEAKAREVQKELDAAKATISALETQNKALVAERDAAAERSAKSEAAQIELEVDALVGVKITPAEKDDFIALRKSNPELYAKFVAQRADRKLTQHVIPTKNVTPPSISEAGETDLATEALKSA
jgi:HK97 family phage prohead protease